MQPKGAQDPKSQAWRYEAVSHGIRVVVAPRYLEDRSDPGESRFFWAYTVEITNLSQETIQLRARYWRIVDGNGKQQEVRGPGVVGEEPVILPGDSYEYTSGCPLTTPSGFMVGHYQVETGRGERLTVEIPAFSLDLPGEGRIIN
ncbi:Co2+/Mg2+ efflux protein ApaG [Prosthecomicrobium sp. N25]|uniref:Co2+/Mg2+ efflux protein ApaG n=1 Tax=Prosthecomicrobium sp. N25 TaxID=3129254 RepID=UPI0030783C9C